MVSLHNRKFISADSDKCVGCQICEYACSFTHEKVFNAVKSRIRVVRSNQTMKSIALTCRKCQEPACVAACPRDALSQSLETGSIIIDQNQCNGCGWCIEACNYGAIMMHPECKTVYVCDLCQYRPDGPQCVKWCPEEALTVVTSDVLAQKARLNAIKKLFQEHEETEK